MKNNQVSNQHPASNKILIWIAGIAIGIIIGMILMYFVFTLSFERILEASNGIIQNMQVNLNETKIVDRVFEVISK